MYLYSAIASEALRPGSALLRKGKKESAGEEECLDLNTVTESLLRTVFGSEIQTAGTEHR